MFGPSDKPTIKDLRDAIGREVFRLHGYTEDTPRADIDWQSLSEATCENCWEFLQNTARARALLANGRLWDLRRELFDCPTDTNPTGYHVDLSIGTLGSGDLSRRRSNPDPSAYYGPALHCTILLDRRQLEQFLAKTFGASIVRLARPRVTHDTILQYKREHPEARKADIKFALANSMSVRAFGELWGKATEIDPELKAPGRRRNPNAQS